MFFHFVHLLGGRFRIYKACSRRKSNMTNVGFVRNPLNEPRLLGTITNNIYPKPYNKKKHNWFIS